MLSLITVQRFKTECYVKRKSRTEFVKWVNSTSTSENLIPPQIFVSQDHTLHDLPF